MRLKKLELHGFKSFADRTEVIFEGGVTCIVGPNGCGKSNISDAMRWVLGERSAKLLRGSKMEDVIFNGTDFRKPVSLAEVSLTIDNQDRGLPIDYNEVTITRRLYRSGESEYLINKTLCRLKDIQDLILDTGIGSSSYSMIEQGRIDYILNADAEERRFLIEEAAGISKYKVKKEEAIRKLERTEENRLRLNDIIHEVQKNIQYAERQAKRAAKYQEEFERLKNLETKKAFYDLNLLQIAKEEIQNQKAALESESSATENLVIETRKAQQQKSEGLRDIIDRYREAESERYQLQSKIDQIQQTLKFHQEKRLEMANRSGQIEQEQAQLAESVAQSAVEISEKRHEIDSLSSAAESARQRLEIAEKNLADLEGSLEQLKKRAEHFKNESFQAASQTSKLRNEHHRLNAFLESSSQQKRKQEAGAERLREENTQWETKKQSCESDLSQLSEKLILLTAKKAECDEEISATQTQLEFRKEACEQRKRDLHEKKTRHFMLAEIDQAARANEDALLAEGESFERSLAKSLRDIFTVQEGYEWALEAALDSFSRSLVADDLKTAEILLDRILTQKAAPIGLLIKRDSSQETLSQMEVPVHPRIEKKLIEVVKVREGYESLFDGFLNEIFIAQGDPSETLLQELLPLAENLRFITENGIVLGPRQRIFYRNANVSSENNLFRRQAEIEMLQRDMTSLEDLLLEDQGEIETAQDRLKIILADRETLEAERMSATVQKESLDSFRINLEERLDSLRREMELIRYESEELDSQHKDADARKAQLEEDLKKAEEFEYRLRQEQETLQVDLTRTDSEKSAALQEFAESKAQYSHVEERARLIKDSLEIMEDHDRRNRKRIEELILEAQTIVERLEQLTINDKGLEEEQEKLHETRRETDIVLELIRQEKEKAEEELAGFQKSLQEFLQKQQELQSAAHQFDMKLMDLGFQEKTISERLVQTYRIQIWDLKPEDYPLGDTNPDELTETVSHLKQKVESLGTVNLLAIEEYEELKQRFDFLMTQQKDLDEAREQLMETIRKINRTTKSLFEETFANVQKQFSEYYQTLFRGGFAQLILVDETNPLESGIDIMVRPPGKKNQHISLLSGGEKALTAIALLFALFKIKPSPFCVLDEVDAPLDEANVDRFLTVLKTFLQISQFIIVTHNRKTIAMGDSLYGVTMQEAGVSKLVSVKVNTDAPANPDSGLPKEEKTSSVEEEPVQA
jgi:chromosome segregation protein